jgi:hypothetical protein
MWFCISRLYVWHRYWWQLTAAPQQEKASLVCIPDPLLLLNSPFVSDFSALQRKPDRNR